MLDVHTLINARYRVTSILGQGGMGVAYRAWDLVAKVPVVVKMPIGKESDTRESYERFRREAGGMAVLRHPYIVPVLDEGVDDSGKPYIVIRFLPGGALADRLRRNEKGDRLPNHPSSLHDWLPRIASALDFMHSKGVVHRDVKPANIFFDARSQAFLGDFGIAKVFDTSGGVEKDLTLTSTNMAIGSQAYMAPELFQAKPALAGASDQYALAVTVYEVLSGDRPFRGDSAHIAIEHLTLPPKPLTALLPTLPATISDAVHRALSKKPQDRFATCSDFIEHVIRHVPSLVANDDVTRVMCPSCRRILKLRTEVAGKVGKCNRCEAALHVASDLESVSLQGEGDAGSVEFSEDAATLSSATSKKWGLPPRAWGAAERVRSAARLLWDYRSVVATAALAVVVCTVVLRMSLPHMMPMNSEARDDATLKPTKAPADDAKLSVDTKAQTSVRKLNDAPTSPEFSRRVRSLSRAQRLTQLRHRLWSADGIVLADYLYDGSKMGLVDIPIDISSPRRTRSAVPAQDRVALMKTDGSVYQIKTNHTYYHAESELSWMTPLAEDACQLFSTAGGFAVLGRNGGVVSWSRRTESNDFMNSDVASALTANVLDIASTEDAFAAIKRDGSVLSWGDSSASDSASVANWLGGDVIRVFSSGNSFAALKRDGSVVAWGNGRQRISANNFSANVIEVFGMVDSNDQDVFAGLRRDGSIVMFGPLDHLVESYRISLKSLGVLGPTKWIYATRDAFAALLDDGRVVTWGTESNSDSVPASAREGVVHVVANDHAFAAIKSDGSVVTWKPGRRQPAPSDGSTNVGDEPQAVAASLQSGVQAVVAARNAFAALKNDGSVVAWGDGADGNGGGDARAVADNLKSGVIDIVANDNAFAAIKNTGQIVCWGRYTARNSIHGYVKQALVEEEGVVDQQSKGITLSGDHESVIPYVPPNWTVSPDQQRIISSLLSSGCVDVVATEDSFVALTATGAAVPWGGEASLNNISESFTSQEVEDKSQLAGSGVLHLATPLSTGIRLPSPVIGIAICHNAASDDLHGVWEYRSAESAEWLPIPTDVANASALVLRTDACIRFRAHDGFYGTPGGLMMTLTIDPSLQIRDGERLDVSNTDVIGWIPVSTTCPALRPHRESKQSAVTERLTNSIGVMMRLIPSGTFTMGSKEIDRHWSGSQQVTLTHPFYLGVHEVTNGQWKKVMGSVGQNLNDDDKPINNVSWDEATEFCRRLSALPEEQSTGRAYRLPTEAEWEYACRAGTTTRYSFGDDESLLGEYAWYQGNSDDQTHPVGLKKPNTWGLHDMHGNVKELCKDSYKDYVSDAVVTDPGALDESRPGSSYWTRVFERAVRGGDYRSGAVLCSSAMRYRQSPKYCDGQVGFRLAMSSAAVERVAATANQAAVLRTLKNETIVGQQPAADMSERPLKLPVVFAFDLRQPVPENVRTSNARIHFEPFGSCVYWAPDKAGEWATIEYQLNPPFPIGAVELRGVAVSAWNRHAGPVFDPDAEAFLEISADGQRWTLVASNTREVGPSAHADWDRAVRGKRVLYLRARLFAKRRPDREEVQYVQFLRSEPDRGDIPQIIVSPEPEDSSDGLAGKDAEPDAGLDGVAQPSNAKVTELLTLEMLGLKLINDPNSTLVELMVQEGGYMNVVHEEDPGLITLWSYQERSANRGTLPRDINAALGWAVRGKRTFVFEIRAGNQRRRVVIDAAATVKSISDGKWKESASIKKSASGSD